MAAATPRSRPKMRDVYGDEVSVLCVKGSGWDLATIEPEGLPAVRLEPLRKLRSRDGLTDEDMVSVQRANLLDTGAPNPSVETLLHAFLPHKFVDHTHSTAVRSPISPMRRGDLRRRSMAARGLRALHDPGLRSREGGRFGLRGRSRCRRADADQARHLPFGERRARRMNA